MSFVVCVYSPGVLELGTMQFPARQINRGVLHMQRVQEPDAGEYICEASNQAGSSSDTVTLQVGGENVFKEVSTNSFKDLY